VHQRPQPRPSYSGNFCLRRVDGADRINRCSPAIADLDASFVAHDNYVACGSFVACGSAEVEDPLAVTEAGPVGTVSIDRLARHACQRRSTRHLRRRWSECTYVKAAQISEIRLRAAQQVR